MGSITLQLNFFTPFKKKGGVRPVWIPPPPESKPETMACVPSGCDEGRGTGMGKRRSETRRERGKASTRMCLLSWPKLLVTVSYPCDLWGALGNASQNCPLRGLNGEAFIPKCSALLIRGAHGHWLSHSLGLHIPEWQVDPREEVKSSRAGWGKAVPLILIQTGFLQQWLE